MKQFDAPRYTAGRLLGALVALVAVAVGLVFIGLVRHAAKTMVGDPLADWLAGFRVGGFPWLLVLFDVVVVGACVAYLRRQRRRRLNTDIQAPPTEAAPAARLGRRTG